MIGRAPIKSLAAEEVQYRDAALAAVLSDYPPIPSMSSQLMPVCDMNTLSHIRPPLSTHSSQL